MEQIKTQVQIKTGEFVKGIFEIFEEDEHDPDIVKLTLLWKDNNIMVKGPDFFDALQSLRIELEKLGCIPICNGSSRNVYPSPMQRNMGYGRTAYLLTIGKQAKKADIVDIFEKTVDIQISSVQEQNLFYQQWLKSVTEE